MSRTEADAEGGGDRAVRKAAEDCRSFEPLKMESIMPCVLSEFFCSSEFNFILNYLTSMTQKHL